MPRADVRQYGAFLVQQQRGVLILRLLRDKLVGHLELNEIEDELRDVMPLAETAMVLDCQRVSGPASSEFLSMLLRLKRRAESEGLQLGVCGLTGPLAQACEVCRFDKVVPRFSTSFDAVREFGLFSHHSRDQIEAIKKAEHRSERGAGLRGLVGTFNWQDARVQLATIFFAGILLAWLTWSFVAHLVLGPEPALRQQMWESSRGKSTSVQ